MSEPIWLKSLDRLLTWTALIVGGSTLAFMMVLGTTNVLVMRKLMNAPIRGAEDLMVLALVTLVAVAIPFGGRVGAHIEIEVLEPRMPPAFAHWSMLILRLLGGGLMLLMAWELAQAGQKASKFGETTQQLLISYEPFYYLLSLCVVLYALVLFSDIVQLVSNRKIKQISLGEVV